MSELSKPLVGITFMAGLLGITASYYLTELARKPCEPCSDYDFECNDELKENKESCLAIWQSYTNQSQIDDLKSLMGHPVPESTLDFLSSYPGYNGCHQRFHGGHTGIFIPGINHVNDKFYTDSETNTCIQYDSETNLIRNLHFPHETNKIVKGAYLDPEFIDSELHLTDSDRFFGEKIYCYGATEVMVDSWNNIRAYYPNECPDKISLGFGIFLDKLKEKIK